MNRPKAFTLIELLVAITIAAIIICMAMGIARNKDSTDIDINPILFPEAAAAQALQRMERNSRK